MIGTSRSVWGFDPRSVPGCQLWLDAADSSTITFSSGSNVSSWADKSGNGRNGTSTGSPTLSSGQIVFSGSQWFSGSITNTSANLTAFVVAKTTTSPATQHSRILSASAGGNDFDNTPSMDVMVYVDTANTLTSFRNLVTLSTVTTTPNQTFLAVTKTNATTNTFYLNGTASSTVTLSGGAVGSFGYTTYWVGSGPTGANLTGTISEVLYYHADLTTSERQQIEGYLAHKWGLTGYYDSSIPLTIPGCQLWLDPANSGSLTLSGANVLTISNSSGTGGIATRLAGNSYATTTTISGNRILSFPGGEIVYRSPMVLTGGAYTIFTISSLLSGSGYQRMINTDGPSDGRIFVGAINGILATFSGNRGWNDIIANTPSYTLTAAGLQIVTIIVSGSSLIPYINGTAMNPKVGTTGSTTVLDIGAFEDGVSQPWNGYIGDIIVYNTALTTTQRQTIEGYLSKKWGIGSSMIPSTHPFSSIRPHLRTFQPIDVPGCALWLDAADQSSMTLSGSSVTQWNDKSGNGYNALPNAGGSAITMGTLNSVPAITFPAASTAAFLPSSSLTVGSGGYSVFFVANQTSFASGGTRIYSANSGGIQSAIDNTPSPRILTVVIDGSVMSSTFTMISNVPFMYSYTISSSTSGLWKNGISAGTAGGSTTSISNFYIGNFAFPSSSLAFTGQMGEFLIFNTALTTSQRQQVEGYLAHKWGLSLSLPVISPLSIPGCQLWLDAADSSTVAFSSGSNVSSWADKSGNGNTVTQATTANQPTYVTNVVNGNPVIRFNGTTNILQKTSFTSLGTNSVSFWLVERNLSGGMAAAPFSFNNGPNAGIVFQNNNNLQPMSNVPYTSSVARIDFYNRTNTGSGDITYLNGNVSSTGDDNSTGTYGTTFAVGQRIFSSIYTSGDICEILIFIGMPTTTQRQQIEGYLARKWGISISATLPSPHPFKSFPPASLPFSPRNISGCQLWLDGADQSSMTFSGSNVTQWNDKSGNGYNMNTIAGSSSTYWSGTPAYPTIGTSINNLPTVNFKAQSGLKQATTLDGVKNLFWIGRIAAPDGSGSAPNYFLLGHDSVYDWSANAYGDKFLYAPIVPSGINNASASLFTSDANAVTNTAFQNVYLPSAPNVSLLSVSGITGTTRYQGICYDRDIHIGWCGDLAEVLIFSTALTTSQRQQVEGYLAQKWGLTTSLPATHPYKKLPA